MKTNEETKVVHTRADLRAAINESQTRKGGKVALVMTMGALHEGHLDLVRRAHELADTVVVSIFVNPLQFAPGEDFDAYPRTLDADVEKLQTVGSQIVFAPSAEDVFPGGAPAITFNPGPVGQILEGKTRPTHFAGVLQIVNKVMNLVQPDYALFGQKDAQQLAIIKQMVRDLDMQLEVVAVPIRRETDGLAMSSRNQYLSETEREQALALSRALETGREVAARTASAAAVVDRVESELSQAPGVKLDYVALIDPLNFTPIPEGQRATGVLAVAAWVGKTRLIDNTLVVVGK
ncbi:pantoate--beta-alanine ligase [Boudabousia liubingyangii]|uniref:Pantothenate synthetase n=1 Tax=Boudabousia liubingyangii TaxID=1921764 RepID=A0A1Q5PLE1_9ACTO|nr:pantoate--beta-alanine ligase [Boudabousia liubingyangii]OKL47069.1 pantoate--beta-alanine ligase [Boudabousia liubingyangii]OKL47869.1 pantoate--beta-alanine ligase [Boudabousia liubingyangii]